jgi:hypothetical protein
MNSYPVTYEFIHPAQYMNSYVSLIPHPKDHVGYIINFMAINGGGGEVDGVNTTSVSVIWSLVQFQNLDNFYYADTNFAILAIATYIKPNI